MQEKFHPNYLFLYQPILKQTYVTQQIGVSVTQLKQYLRGGRRLDPMAEYRLQEIHKRTKA